MIRHPIKISDEQVLIEKEKNQEIRKNEPLKEQLEHFIDCVKNYKEKQEEIEKIINIGEEEYYTTKICELAIESAKLKNELELR